MRRSADVQMMRFFLGALCLVALIFVGVDGDAHASTGVAAAVTVNDTGATTPVNRALFGTNYPIWARTPNVNTTARTPWPSVTALAQQQALGLIRMDPVVNLANCGGTDCTYHWMLATPGAPGYGAVTAAQLSPDEWMRHVSAVGTTNVTPLIEVNVEAGTVAEAQDWIAYMNGSTTSTQTLTDGSTVGQWARLRATNGHAAPYGVHLWEIGNEETGLHVCSPGQYARGCTDNPPSACASYTGHALYGCLVVWYGRALKLVDGSIAVVAGFDGTPFTDFASTAGSAANVFDLHEYPDANMEPYGTTFDTDGQRATYPVSYTTTSASQPVSIGLWLGASGPAHVDAYVDGAVIPTTSFDVPTSQVSAPYVLGVTDATAGSHTHTVQLTACASASVVAGMCTPAGQHTAVYLEHITTTLGAVSAAALSAGRSPCFAGLSGFQHLNGSTPTSLVDTRVSATTGASGGANSPGTPWRLAANSDFPVAFAAGSAQVFSGGTTNQSSKLAYWRRLLAQAGYGSTPLVLGEYGTWASCGEQPADLVASQSAGIWTALVTAAAYSDGGLAGAATYDFGGGAPAVCTGWHLMTTPLTSTGICQGKDAAYLSPVGLALAQFGTLAGNVAPVSVSGAPWLLSYPSAGQLFTYAHSVTGVASKSGNTVTVVLINACPATSQCGDGTVATTIGLASHSVPTVATATTVAGTPFADNSDTAPAAVAAQPLAAVIAGGNVAVTLPPFSVTRVTITTP